MLDSIIQRGVALTSSVVVIGSKVTPIDFRELSISVKPTTVNMAEAYLDYLPPGGDPTVNGDWITVYQNTDFSNAPAEYGIRKISTVGINAVTAGNWAFAWVLVPPCQGIRFRAKGTGTGTVDVLIGFGRE